MLDLSNLYEHNRNTDMKQFVHDIVAKGAGQQLSGQMRGASAGSTSSSSSSSSSNSNNNNDNGHGMMAPDPSLLGNLDMVPEENENAMNIQLGDASNLLIHDHIVSWGRSRGAFSSSTSSSNSSTGGTNISDQRQEDVEDYGNISVKDAFWFLDSLENYHRRGLTQEQREKLETSELRHKPKHRNAVLFCDDEAFVLQQVYGKMYIDEEKFENGKWTDRRVFVLHEAIQTVLRAYARSLNYAAPKSCIWSALMYRVAFYLQESGFQQVNIDEHVEGVRHKEATLFIQGYHISRSNFTKLCRQLLRKEHQKLTATGTANPL